MSILHFTFLFTRPILLYPDSCKFKIEEIGLAGQIKSYRIQKGLSHKKLGKILGVDPSSIGTWEPISKINLKRLLKILAK